MPSLNERAAREKIMGSQGYQMVFSGWVLAAIIAGFESLLLHDKELAPEQRIILTKMIADFRGILGEDAEEAIEGEAVEIAGELE